MMNPLSRAVAGKVSRIQFYHVPESPPCRAVEMVASLVGIEMEKHQMDLFAKEHLKEDYIRLNPRHKVPFVIDGDLRLGESRAIMRYLVNKTPESPLYPCQDIRKRAKIDELLDFDIGTLYMRGIKLFWPMLFRGSSELNEDDNKKHHEVLVLVEDQLKGGHRFLTGDQLTIGDVSVAATLTLPLCCGFNFTDYPSIDGYLRRVRQSIPEYGKINDRAIENFSNFVRLNSSG